MNESKVRANYIADKVSRFLTISDLDREIQVFKGCWVVIADLLNHKDLAELNLSEQELRECFEHLQEEDLQFEIHQHMIRSKLEISPELLAKDAGFIDPGFGDETH